MNLTCQIHREFDHYYILKEICVKTGWSVCSQVLMSWASWSSQAVLTVYYTCVFLVLLSSCLTLPLLFKILSSESILLFISNEHIRKMISFTVHHHRLMCNLALATKTMWSCKKCVSWSLLCCVSSESFKCSECMSHTSHKYNLIIFKAEWAQVQHECVWLQVKVQLAINWAQEEMTHLSHLQKQQDLIESHWEKMIWQKFQNIKELKTDKAHEASETVVVPFLNEFLINMSSDQIKVSVNFNLWFWPENVPLRDTSQ